MRNAINSLQILKTLVRTPHATSVMSQNKNLKRKTTFTFAQVALDIFLLVARKPKVTAKRSLLKIACLMTVSFRASLGRIHNLNCFFSFLKALSTDTIITGTLSNELQIRFRECGDFISKLASAYLHMPVASGGNPTEYSQLKLF